MYNVISRLILAVCKIHTQSKCENPPEAYKLYWLFSFNLTFTNINFCFVLSNFVVNFPVQF